MALASRTSCILRYLDSSLDQSLPSRQVFLKCREQIVLEGSSENLKELLKIEHELSAEKKRLSFHIKEVKDDEKKKAFACSRQKLIVVEKKLKDISKQLSKHLIESNYVKGNLDKMLDVINWMKQRIDQDVQLLLSGAYGTMVSETTIQKKEEMMKVESNLVKNIKTFQHDEQALQLRELKVATVKREIDKVEAEILIYQDGNDPTLLNRNQSIQMKKQSTYRLGENERHGIMERLDNAKKKFQYDTDSHDQSIRMLKNRFLGMENNLQIMKQSHSETMIQLDGRLKESTERREMNLKELLQLRVKWKHYEDAQNNILRERLKVQELERYEEKRREAVELIQNRLSLLYKSRARHKRKKKNK